MTAKANKKRFITGEKIFLSYLLMIFKLIARALAKSFNSGKSFA